MPHFARLCRDVGEDLGADVLVFCEPGEGKLLHELGEQTRDLARMEIVQNLHLRHVAALLSRCRLYLGNDSGLMHLAAAVGTPVVILLGPAASLQVFASAASMARRARSSASSSSPRRTLSKSPRSAFRV